MKRIILIASIIFVSLVSRSFATDYASIWFLGDGETAKIQNQFFVKGFTQGISWAKTFSEFVQTVPPSKWDVRQRLMFNVFSNTKKIEASAVEHIMSSLYKDPVNTQIHPNLIFFAAAAKLLGFPENEVAETLRLFRVFLSR